MSEIDDTIGRVENGWIEKRGAREDYSRKRGDETEGSLDPSLKSVLQSAD